MDQIAALYACLLNLLNIRNMKNCLYGAHQCDSEHEADPLNIHSVSKISAWGCTSIPAKLNSLVHN